MNEFIDWIVVGSGPGGFVASTELSKKDYKILLLEKGKSPNPRRYSSDISISELYDDVSIVMSQSPFGFGQGSCLGGGSVVNGALFWQLPKHTEKDWKNRFGSEFIDSINKNYNYYKRLLKVSYNHSSIGNKDSEIMKRASEKLGWKVVPVPRALKDCRLNNNCGFGCESKISLDKLYGKYDIEIRLESKVSKILMRKSRAIGVKLTNGEVILANKGVALAAGAIHSHTILRNSGIKKKSFPQFHINLKFVAEHNEILNSSNGTMFTYQMQEFIGERMLLMPTNFSRKSLLSSLLHLNLKHRKDLFDNRENCGIYVLQIQPFSIGKIKRVFGKDYFFYNLNKKDLRLIQTSVKRTIRLLKVAGFNKIVIPSKMLNRSYDLDTFDDSIIDDIKSWDFISVHGMSANKIGTSPENSVCDINGLIYGTENIYVVDSSCLPSNTGESPQGVIMSVAKKIIDGIL